MKLTYILICLFFTTNLAISEPFLHENIIKLEGVNLDINKIITNQISGTINLETDETLSKSCNIRYEGDENWLKNLDFILQNNELNINQNSLQNKGNISPVFHIKCNSKVFYDLNNSGKTTLKIKDIKNDIFISGAGYLSLDLNHLQGNLDITFQGNIDVNINEIYGNVNIESNGYSKFSLKKGKIETLVLELEGYSKFKADAMVFDAETALVGSGSIELNNLQGNLNRLENIGNGEIKFRKRN